MRQLHTRDEFLELLDDIAFSLHCHLQCDDLDIADFDFRQVVAELDNALKSPIALTEADEELGEILKAELTYGRQLVYDPFIKMEVNDIITHIGKHLKIDGFYKRLDARLQNKRRK